MKKIMTAAALAAMAVSFAAADVKITMNGRLRPYLYSHVETDNGSKTTKANTWMDLDGLAAFEDTLKFAFTNKDNTAGLTFSVNVKNGNGTSEVSSDKYTSDAKNATSAKLTESNNKFGNFFTLNEYSIWSTVFGTDLKLGAGSWKDGFADGAYRVKNDVDAGNAEGIDFERFKLGSAFKGAPSLFVDDIGNIAGGSNALAGYAEYPIALNDTMSLKLTAIAVDSSFDTVTDDDTTDTYSAGWAGRAQFNVKDVVNTELIVKKPVHNETVFAFYAQPKMVKGLDATVGGSYTMASGSNDKWDGAWDVDLRVRYQATKALSITTFNKISGLDAADGTAKTNSASAAVSSGIVGLDGKGGKLLNGNDITSVMWNNLSARYVINPSVTATVNLGLMSVLANESDADYGINFRGTVGAQLYLSSNASLWAALSYSTATYNDGTSGAKDLTVSAFAVPVIFRVKM